MARELPDARVIVLTTYTGDVHILRALKAGAEGYLLKSTLHQSTLGANDRTQAAVSGLKRGIIDQ